MHTLFIDDNGVHYDADMIVNILKNVGAHDCDNLFIHSDIMFGKVPSDFNRKEYLRTLSEILEGLGVKNIIIPTFTYSFCNKEVYDVQNSRTSMGALNEYIRKQQGRYRSMDPLLSISVPDCLKNKFNELSDHSLGEGSGLDIVHNLGEVKFLFLGIPMGSCFTYLHYVEKMLDVPYRFDYPFEGEIIDYDGNRYTCKQYIHTACYGVKPRDFYHFEDYLEDIGMMKKARLGNKFVECISEKDAYTQMVEMIHKDINYFLEKPFTKDDLLKKYTKGLNGERITHC